MSLAKGFPFERPWRTPSVVERFPRYNHAQMKRRIWWIQFFAHGRQVRESSRSDRRPVAERLLRQRLGEAAAGIASPPRAARISYEEIRDALFVDYR